MGDRFSQIPLRKPFPQSFWVCDGLLCAGHYPGDLDARQREIKLQGLVDCGIRRVINVMEIDEKSLNGKPFEPYESRLNELADAAGFHVEHMRLSIRDASVPTPAIMHQILKVIDESILRQIPTFLHCWGGHGRTSMVVACYLIHVGFAPQAALDEVQRFRSGLPKSHIPFDGDQKNFVVDWPLHSPRPMIDPRQSPSK